jgi:hypothetical protein
MGMQGRMGLPLHIDRVSLLRMPDQAVGRLYAVVTPDPERERFDADVVDSAGNICLQLRGYRTVPVPNAVDPERLKVLQTLISAEAVVAA